MATLKIYDIKAKEVGKIELPDEIFAVEFNEDVIHEAVVAYNANQRQGNKSVLTRSEVRGHAKKPWRQKKTGRARHGDTKAPQFRGGGAAFAPKPRDFSKKMNKKVKGFAFLSAISQKIAQDEVIVLNNLSLADAKTKEMVNVLDAFKLTGKTVVVTKEKNDDVVRASGNLKNLTITTADLLSTYEIVANKKLMITEEAIKSIEEAFAL